MPKDPEEDIAPALAFEREEVDRLGYGLVDGLVEPADVAKGVRARLVRVGPQIEHGGPERPVLGNHLIHREAASGAQHGMRFCGCLGAMRCARSLPTRLGDALATALADLQIPSDGLQDLLCMIPQPG